MASNRRTSPCGSPFAFGSHLLLTLITLYLFFEILRLPTTTSAIPINHLGRRRDDSGRSDPSTYHAATDSNVGPVDHFERDVGKDIKTTFKDIGTKIKNVFVPEGDKKTTVDFVAEYADDELDHHVPIKELKESFKKNYVEMKHSDHKMSDEDWVHDQIKSVVPGLKKVYDEANKTDFASNHHSTRSLSLDEQRQPLTNLADHHALRTREDYVPEVSEKFKSLLSDAANEWQKGDTKESTEHCPAFRDHCSTAIWYDSANFLGRNAVKRCINHLSDHPACLVRVKDQAFIKPYLDGLVSEGKIKGYRKRDAGDKPRPKPGDADYYTDPSFFPYPMPPTPDIADELKNQLGDAFNKWRAGTIESGDPSCKWGSGRCNKADAITTKVDYTPKDKRKQMVEACIISLIANPRCLAKYQSTNVLKPYLTELVDNGKIKDEDGVIKKFYKRGLIEEIAADAGAIWTPKPVKLKDEPQSITEDAKNSLASTWNRTKWHIDNGITQVCEPKENACDDAKLVLTQKNDAQRKIEACIGFLADFPGCLERYKHDVSVAPYLNQLIDEKKIESVDGKITQQGPLETSKANQKRDTVKLNSRRGELSSKGTSAHGFERRKIPVAPKLPIGQNFKDVLAGAFRKYKEDVASHSDMSCPLTAENACEKRALGSLATHDEDRQQLLERCIVFLGWHPNCLERYKAWSFIKPHLDDLDADGKLDGYQNKRTLVGKVNQKWNGAVQPRAPRGGRSRSGSSGGGSGRSRCGSQAQSNGGAKCNPKGQSNSQAAPAAPSASKPPAAGPSSPAGGQAAQNSASVAAPAASAPAIQKSAAVSQAPVVQKSISPAPSAASPSTQMSRPAVLSAVSVSVAAPAPSIAQNRGPSASSALMSGAESPAAKPSASAANNMDQPPVAPSAPVSLPANSAMPSASSASQSGGAASNAEPAVPGGSQSMQGQAGHGGKDSSFDPTELARQGVHAISQLQPGHAGQGAGTVGPGSPGYMDPALQPGQGTGLSGNAPTETAQDAGMAGSGPSEYVDPVGGPGAPPVDPQMQGPGVDGSVPNHASLISNTFPVDHSVASAIPSVAAAAPNEGSVALDDTPVVGAEGGVTGATVPGSSTGDGSAIPQAQAPGSAESGDPTVNPAGSQGTANAQNGAGTAPLGSTQPAGTMVVAEQ